RHRTSDLGAEPFGHRFGLLPRQLFESAGEHYRLACHRGVGLRLLGIENAHLLRQPLDDPAVMLLAEIGGEGVDHRIADLVESVHLLTRFRIALRQLDTGVMKRLPGAIATREHTRGGLPDMADAQRIDEALERHLAPGADRFEQVADRDLAVTFLLLQAQLVVARFEGKDVGWLLEPTLFIEECDLLLAQPFDIEGAARDEMAQM